MMGEVAITPENNKWKILRLKINHISSDRKSELYSSKEPKNLLLSEA